MNSLWEKTVSIEGFPRLSGDRKTDVLVIGGGIAGILCARFLHDAGVETMLVEGNRIGSGATKNTTAKITSQHGLIYQKIKHAKQVLEANQMALDMYRKLCAGIDCDFLEKDAYVYSLKDRKAIEKEVSALNRLGFGAEFAESVQLPFYIAGAVRFPKQAQFHPLKFIAGIAKGLNIYENTKVEGLAPYTAVTAHGKIKAKHIIVATHFPFLNKHGAFFLKMYQHRSYVVALENAPDVGGMYLEEKKNGLSFRNQGKYLLIGGGDHKTGKKGGNWQVLRDFAANTYPEAQEKYAWATQDCMTLDSVPYIGRYGKSAGGLYVATGFNKWGMTSSMVSAMIMRDLVLGRKNEYAAAFSPQRGMMKPQLLVNGLAAVGNLLTPTTKRCPHVGCALKWNPVESSWDCPCHGSRFDRSGICLSGPATGNLDKSSRL
jgi:glycine/D-amino acid oxidase-like deaminating enzyme